HLAENGEAPLSQELGLLLREQRLGIPWDEALARLEQRVPSEATALTAAALRIATRSGGNLAEALDRIADTLRARSQLQARLRALTSQGRMQAWIVGALPVLLLAVLYQLEPAIMSLLWRTPAGWGVLALLVALEAAGVVLIRRIVRVDA
ncbi:type II secretion system F family protein, partial [Achromobacter sp. Marseille-Q0513]|uniref:type II secretion system F family protein n=1 Tax=Achromobacter sp. Marseille-Q0513 TaxID=2829161 RepID=UPI001B97DD4D